VEVVATLSLATDLSLGVPLEHGLHSALIARRLSDLMEVDPGQASEAFYTALLFYEDSRGGQRGPVQPIGDVVALTTYATPVRFDRPGRQMRGMARAVAPGRAPRRRASGVLSRGPARLVAVSLVVMAVSCFVPLSAVHFYVQGLACYAALLPLAYSMRRPAGTQRVSDRGAVASSLQPATRVQT
jgi:hypothetical protein